jgi:hypothetical protein
MAGFAAISRSSGWACLVRKAAISLLIGGLDCEIAVAPTPGGPSPRQYAGAPPLWVDPNKKQVPRRGDIGPELAASEGGSPGMLSAITPLGNARTGVLAIPVKCLQPRKPATRRLWSHGSR